MFKTDPHMLQINKKRQGKKGQIHQNFYTRERWNYKADW